MISICVTHQKPMIPTNWFDVELALGDYKTGDDYHISNLNLYWHNNRSLAYGAAGSYSMPDLLQKAGVWEGLVRITSYRKAVVKNPVTLPVPPSAGMYFMSSRVAGETELTSLLPHAASEFLVARPIRCEPSVFDQYSKLHKICDLINYCSLAIDLEILDEREAREFFSVKYLIQGGVELGVFPVRWLHGVLGQLSALGREFLDRHGKRVINYDSYQIRSVGFLSERLGSYLLLKELKRRFPGGVPSSTFGTLITISDDGEYCPGRA